MAAEVEKKRLVVIGDGLLTTMASNPTYVAQFPFLAALQSHSARKGCSRCSKEAKERLGALNAAKAAIAGLDADSRRKLRELLNANSLRVRYTEGARTIEKTFS